MATRKDKSGRMQHRANLWVPEDVQSRAKKVSEADRRRLVDVFRYALELGLGQLEERLGIKPEATGPPAARAKRSSE